MYTFFDVDGKTIINKIEFIKKYNAYYYTGMGKNSCFYQNHKDFVIVKRNSIVAESLIEKYLFEGFVEEDVRNILAWKIGKINNYETEKTNSIVLSWKDLKKANICKGQYCNIKKISKIIMTIKNQVNKNNDILCEAEQIFNKFNEYKDDFIGIGPTYRVAIVYFLLKGRFPIYDQFAGRAIKAIIMDKQPGTEIDSIAILPNSKTKYTGIEILKELTPFIESIKKIFGDEYYSSRDVDRALWVYGHMYKKV